MKRQTTLIWVVLIIYGGVVLSEPGDWPSAGKRTNEYAGDSDICSAKSYLAFSLGFLGLMLAVPLSACLAVLVDEMYVKDVLGDR